MESHEQSPQRRFEQSEIIDIFSTHAEGKILCIDRMKEDENGMYLLEASAPEEDGGKVEYSFTKKGEQAECKVARTCIDKVYYDPDGIPCGGEGILFFNEGNGEWQEA